MKSNRNIPRPKVCQLINGLIEICDSYEEDQKRSNFTAASIAAKV